jgi:hypothetical protein
MFARREKILQFASGGSPLIPDSYFYFKRVKGNLYFRSSNKAGSMNRAQTVQVIIPSSTTEAMDLIPA